MANAQTPSDLIAERLRGLLDDRRMTVRELAGRCAAAGMPKLTAQALYKLVGQRDRRDRPPRPVTVDELLALACALDINPLYLICAGDDRAAEIPVTPEIRPKAAEVWLWVQGMRELPGMSRQDYIMSLPAAARADYVQDPEGALAMVDKRLAELARLREDITEDIERRRSLQDRVSSVRGPTVGGGA